MSDNKLKSNKKFRSDSKSRSDRKYGKDKKFRSDSKSGSDQKYGKDKKFVTRISGTGCLLAILGKNESSIC